MQLGILHCMGNPTSKPRLCSHNKTKVAIMSFRNYKEKNTKGIEYCLFKSAIKWAACRCDLH